MLGAPPARVAPLYHRIRPGRAEALMVGQGEKPNDSRKFLDRIEYVMKDNVTCCVCCIGGADDIRAP